MAWKKTKYLVACFKNVWVLRASNCVNNVLDSQQSIVVEYSEDNFQKNSWLEYRTVWIAKRYQEW